MAKQKNRNKRKDRTKKARIATGPVVAAPTTNKLLSVRDLRVEFRTDDGIVKAVNGVSFDLAPGETMGLVGESGSGKSVTNLALMGLVPQPPGRISGGSVKFRGQELVGAPPELLRSIRGKQIAMIFQDPMTSLNPFLTIDEQMTEVTMLHLGHSREQATRHAIDMLEMVGIPSAAHRVFQYPHEFSGGMRQRVMIAMALSCQPDILIADEPTTALDVTVQAQILELMKKLQEEHGTAIILITHDLGVVAKICQRVFVMYAGHIVEKNDVRPLFADPRHPYTIGLLNSVPRWDEDGSHMLKAIEGQPPDLARLGPGCPFYPRCPYRMDKCLEQMPPLYSGPSGGKFACYANVDQDLPKEIVYE